MQKEMFDMQKHTLSLSAASILCLLLVSPPAFAQSTQNLMKVRTSFDFQIGEKQFPAGEYSIKRDLHSPQFLTLESADMKSLIMVQPIVIEQLKEPARNELIFKEYGAKRFLSEIRIRGRGVRYALRKTKTERREAQRMEPKTIHAIMSENVSN
jgi:hypothetical protein